MNERLLFFLFFIIVTYTHGQIGCGFDQLKDSLENSYSEIITQTKADFDSFAKSAQGQSVKGNYSTITIPVVFHVVHGGELEGQGSNISDELIEEQLAILNNDFAQLNLSPKTGFGSPEDTKFRFCFAQTDPFGQPTDGITRRFGNDYYVVPNGNGVPPDDIFIKSTRWNPNFYLNIYITDLRSESNENDLYLASGYSSNPEAGILINGVLTDKENPLDGIVMNYRFIGTDPNYVGPQRNQVLAHEVGHWLGLYHVFQSASCGFVSDNGIDCLNYSDGLCDTPFLGEPSSLSIYGGYSDVQSCTGQYVSPKNLMDYGPEISFFTEDQVERMHQKMAFYRPDIYNMTILNSDCTLNHNISLGGSGGGGTSAGYCSNYPVDIIYNSFFDLTNPLSFPYVENGFGTSVDMNQDWLVGTDGINGWLQIFKRVDSQFVSFQNFNQSSQDFGKEVILNKDEIIVSSNSKIYIYSYASENWSLSQTIIPPNGFNGIYLKNNFIFALGSSTITVYKRNSIGNYSYHQTMNHNFITDRSSGVAAFPGSNGVNSRLILLGNNKQITVIGLGASNGYWAFESTQTFNELPNPDYGGLTRSISTTESNIFIMYRKTGQYGAPPHKNTLYIHPISTYDLDSSSSNNSPFQSYDIQGAYYGYGKYNSTKRTRKIHAINDDVIFHRFNTNGVDNTGADIIVKDGNSWRQMELSEYCNQTFLGFKEANDFRIFNNEFVLGGDGILEVRNLNCFVDDLNLNNYNQICDIPLDDMVFSEEIIIGGQCTITFENVSKSIVAKDYIKLLPGTTLKSGSDVHLFTSEYTDYECYNLQLPDDIYSLKANLSSFMENLPSNNGENLVDVTDDILLFPNPTDGMINVATKENIVSSVTVLGMNSMQLFYFENAQKDKSFKLNLSNLSSGIFILHFLLEDGNKISKKLLKIK